MPQLSITDTETASLRVTTKAAPHGGAGCQHVNVTYEADGQARTFPTHESELSEPVTEEEERRMVLVFLRMRKQRGKSQVGVRIV